jgi:hypothetical protein
LVKTNFRRAHLLLRKGIPHLSYNLKETSTGQSPETEEFRSHTKTLIISYPL